jgi:predicted phosphodiesterase
LWYHTTWIREEKAKIIGIADVHIGSPHSRLQELRRLIEENQDAYFVFLGDVIDNAIIDSVSDTYEQTMSPEKALTQFTTLLDMCRDRTLGIVGGNHEERTKRRVGVDLLRLIAEERGIPYSEDILILDIAVGVNAQRGSRKRIQYTLVCAHGYSGARTVGGKITANGRIIDVVTNGDIYLTAHTHQPSVVKGARFEADTRNKKLLQREFFLVTVPSWLGYEHYAAQRFMHPTAGGYIELHLSGLKKDISILIK